MVHKSKYKYQPIKIIEIIVNITVLNYLMIMT